MIQPTRRHQSDIATLRPEIKTSLINGCWPYDRYKEQQPLDAAVGVPMAASGPHGVPIVVKSPLSTPALCWVSAEVALAGITVCI